MTGHSSCTPVFTPPTNFSMRSLSRLLNSGCLWNPLVPQTVPPLQRPPPPALSKPQLDFLSPSLSPLPSCLSPPTSHLSFLTFSHSPSPLFSTPDTFPPRCLSWHQFATLLAELLSPRHHSIAFDSCPSWFDVWRLSKRGRAREGARVSAEKHSDSERA